MAEAKVQLLEKFIYVKKIIRRNKRILKFLILSSWCSVFAFPVIHKGMRFNALIHVPTSVFKP